MSNRVPEPDPRYHVAAAERALILLQTVANHSPATISSLTQQLGWTKPMVFRLVRTLHSCGALRLSDDGYRLGPMMISLGYGALQSMSLVDSVKPVLAQIHKEVGESVILTVLDGTDIVYVDFIETDHLLVFRARLGTRLPAYLTSSGHALLSRTSTEDLHELFDGYQYKPPTPHSVSSFEVLERRLDVARNRGYALIDQELALGHRSVAAPIIDHTGQAAAAISISVPAVRTDLSQLRTMAEESLLPATRQLSIQLGAPESAI